MPCRRHGPREDGNGPGACLQAEKARHATQSLAGLAPGPTLVVCPTSVVGNWEREAKKFVPELKVAVHHGVGRAREGGFSKKVAGADLVITSYSLLDRDHAVLESVQWSRMVLDEAQNIKTPGAKQTRAARSLTAPRRLALTGTPVENHLGELWSIMEVLNPGLLGSASAFREHFTVPIERYHKEDAAESLAGTHPAVRVAPAEDRPKHHHRSARQARDEGLVQPHPGAGDALSRRRGRNAPAHRRG